MIAGRNQTRPPRVPPLILVTTSQGAAYTLGDWERRQGTILITNAASVATPHAPETQEMLIRIHPPGQPTRTLSSFSVSGREGLNQWYADHVGYRPDDDEYEPDILKLLAFVSEMMYRQTTNDDR
jgi:hypothetical protein